MPLQENQLFPRLEPPAGGLARLRSGLAGLETRRPSRRRWAVATALPVAIAALTAIWIGRSRAVDSPEAIFAAEARPVLMRLGVLEPPDDPVTAAGGSEQTLIRVPVNGNQVLFYWAR